MGLQRLDSADVQKSPHKGHVRNHNLWVPLLNDPTFFLGFSRFLVANVLETNHLDEKLYLK